jgi:transposase
LVERVLRGHRAAEVAAQLGCSRTTVYKWLARYRREGAAGLADRPSRPRRCPHRTAPALEARILAARRAHRRGAQWTAAELGLCASTVGRVIARHGLPRLSNLDTLTGQPVRRGPMSGVRYERDRPGELIHVDTKRLGRIPDGGGWRAHGRGPKPEAVRHQGFDYLHAAIDDHSRLAYAEIHPDERGDTCAGFLRRAAAFFAAAGISRIERVMTEQRPQLPALGRVRAGAAGPGCPPPAHPPPLPLDQRQGGAPQPHAAARMGLQPAVHQQCRAGRVPGTLHRALQHAAPPQRTRRPAPDQPSANNVVSDYT